MPVNMRSVCSWSKYTLFYIVAVSMWGALSLIMLLTNQPRGLMFVQFTCFACAILSMCSRYYLVFDCSNSRVVDANVWTFGKSTQQRNFLSESGSVYGMLADDLNTSRSTKLREYQLIHRCQYGTLHQHNFSFSIEGYRHEPKHKRPYLKANKQGWIYLQLSLYS